MTPKRQFKGLWMPAEILNDPKLNHTQKFLYCEIVSLCKVDECYASNRHLADLLMISERSVQRNLEVLKSENYITVKVIRNDQKMVTKRVINVQNYGLKLPHDESDKPYDASDITPPDASGKNLLTPASYIYTSLDTNSENTRAQGVFDLNDSLAEKISQAPTPLERLSNSVNYESKLRKLSQQKIKSKCMREALEAMSVQIMTLKNYPQFYKIESVLWGKFQEYLTNPEHFKNYKKSVVA